MSRLVALTLILGVVATAGGASAAVYVPGHVRDGVYTRPHFLDAPEVRELSAALGRGGGAGEDQPARSRAGSWAPRG